MMAAVPVESRPEVHRCKAGPR